MTASWGDTRREALLSKRRLSAVNSSRRAQPTLNDMSKILVVTYSFTGTGSRLSELLCRSRGWAAAQVVEVRPRRSLATLRCVVDSLLRLRPPIRYDGPDPSGFDVVVLVAPIWLYRLASPVRSFVAEYRNLMRNVAVITLMGGKGGQNAAAEVGHLLGRPPLMSAVFTMGEVDNGSYASRLEAFGLAIESAAELESPVRPLVLSPQSAG